MTISSWCVLLGMLSGPKAARAWAVALLAIRTTGCRGWWLSTGSMGRWNCRPTGWDATRCCELARNHAMGDSTEITKMLCPAAAGYLTLHMRSRLSIPYR